MDMKYTPGPWAYSRWDERGETRFYIAQQDGAPYTPNYSDVATLIAETVFLERRAIQEANARLISAAPELLAVLQEVLVLIPDTYETKDHALAAIAKATGA